LVPRYESGSTWKKAKSKAKLSKSRVKGARLRPLGLLFWLLFAAIFAYIATILSQVFPTPT